jgi:hypothetical protein
MENSPIEFHACPQYGKYEITEQQMIEIAKLAVKLAKEDMEEEGYQGWKKQIAIDVGTTVIEKAKTTIAWMLGGLCLILYIYLDKHNLLDKL